MRAIRCVLLVWILLFCASPDGGQGRDAGERRRPTKEPLTLTNDHPAGSFSLSPATLSSAPSILRVSITRVRNPARTPFEIYVYLTAAEVKNRCQPKKVLVGNFSLYPPDHPGGFLLSTSTAFHKLEAAGTLSPASDVRLLIQMKRIHEAKPWTPVEVTVAPPEWRGDERE